MISLDTKRMVYSFYVNDDSFEHPINKLHFKLLERYIHKFDEVIFCIIIDDRERYDLIQRIEEFLYRRFGRRGYADYASRHNKEEIMQYFWDQNEWTEEKQKVVDDFFSRFEVIDDEPIKTKRIFDEE